MGRDRRLGFRLALVFALLAGAGLAAHAQSVTTERYDNNRTGANLNEVHLNTANVNPQQFGKLWAYSVNGAVYAQPLYVPQLNIAQGVHNVLYVVTMNDAVYAFDADSNVTLWSVNLATAAGGTPVPISDEEPENPGKAGSIGIESTPVIDLSTKTLYLVARTKEGGHYVQRLHAMDIITGAEKFGGPVVIAGSIKGNCNGNSSGNHTFDTKNEDQRSSLALAGGQIFISWDTHKNDNAAQGWVMSYSATTLGQTGIFCSTPGGGMGAISQSGRAPAVDGSGDVYYQSGLGNGGGNNNSDGTFLKFSTANGTPAMVDWFIPDGSSYPLGLSGPMLVPGTNLLAGGGKESVLYLLNASNLGHKQAGNGQIPEALAVNGGPIESGPVYWNRSGGLGPWMYVWADNDFLKAYHFNGSLFDTTPVSQGMSNAPDGGAGTIALSANGSTAGTGILWVSMPLTQTDDAEDNAQGVLRAFNADDLTKELWNSLMNQSQDDMGLWPKFSVPTVAHGRVYMASSSGVVSVYGIPCYTISGNIVNGAGTTVTLNGSGNASTTADAHGNFSFPGVANGNYDVSPEAPGYLSLPSDHKVTVKGSDVTGVNFNLSPLTWSISGTVLNGAGATVTLGGSASGTTTADASGNYSIAGVVNGVYTVTASVAGYIVLPATQSVTVSSANVSGVNFAASNLIPHNGWMVVYADSQETSCESGVANNAIDGNTTTKWVTQWCPTSVPGPHEIQINLGAPYVLDAFQYLARQDGCANGWINQYEFYVSTDGLHWGTPVASGAFDYSGYMSSCPGAGIPPALQIAFAPVTGQYIRLRALSEVNGNPWTAIAELNLLGFPVVNQGTALAGVKLNPSTVTGGSMATGTVTLSAPAPADGAVVPLSSNNGVAVVPPSVTVPAGASTANFIINTSQVSAVTPVSISGNFNAVQSATLVVDPMQIPQGGWSVLYVDSQETFCENGSATNAIDGNSSTYWVTQWCTSSPAAPHEIQIDMGASYLLSAFQYLPRQDGCANGWIKDFEFYVSTDGVHWGTPVVSSSLNYGALNTSCPGAGIPGPMQVNFTPVTAQYIRLRALSEVNGKPWTSMAELNVLGVVAPGANAVLTQVSVSPATMTGGNTAQGTVTLNTAAPLGGALVTLSSNNPAVVVPPNVTVPAGFSTANFTVTTTSVPTSTTVSIGGTYNASRSGTVTVNPAVVPQAAWSVAYVDSQETLCENGAASNAIDGNPGTKWVTQWCGSSTPGPHEIQINLGASYTVSAFQYLARQDGCSNGWIGQYEFYVSTDGVNWGTPVATGTFNYGALSATCPGAGIPPAMQVNFAAVTGRFIRLRALSEVNGNPWTSAAELNVLGAASN